MTHVEINRRHWNDVATHWVSAGERLWARETPVWGNWSIPDDKAPLLPQDMTGQQAVELGCGTGYVSAWMQRRGATVTGIDVSENQLTTAKRLAVEHGVSIDFQCRDAEDTGLPDAAFDFAVSEYGAAIWCDPKRWLPEAWRILKPGGRLAFLGNHPLLFVATPPDGGATQRHFHRSYRHMGLCDWTRAVVEPGGISFNLSIGNWIAQFHQTGFRVLDYKEIYAPHWLDDTRSFLTNDWAKDFPAEQVWWLEKT